MEAWWWAETDPATEVHGDMVSNLADTVESDHIRPSFLHSTTLGFDSTSLIHSRFAADRSTTRLISLLVNLKRQLDGCYAQEQQ